MAANNSVAALSAGSARRHCLASACDACSFAQYVLVQMPVLVSHDITFMMQLHARHSTQNAQIALGLTKSRKVYTCE